MEQNRPKGLFGWRRGLTSAFRSPLYPSVSITGGHQVPINMQLQPTQVVFKGQRHAKNTLRHQWPDGLYAVL